MSKRKSIGGFFSNNFVLKVLSVVFAIIIWSFVILQTNPTRTKTLHDVPVTFEGLAALEAAGLIPLEDYDAQELTVSVKVNVPHSNYRLINNKMISAVVDLSRITKEGAVNAAVNVSFSNAADLSLVSVTPTTVNVVIDQLVERDIPLALETVGELHDGLISLSPVLDDTVTIRGASKYVNTIAHAVATVDLSVLSDGSGVSVPCRFTDSGHNTVRFDTQDVHVDMDVQTVREVNVDTSSLTGETLPKGYELTAVTAGKVLICGHEKDLKGVESVPVKPLDMSAFDETVTSAPLELALPAGLSLLPGQAQPECALKIGLATEEREFTRKITVSGLGNDLTASISDGTSTVRLTADNVIDLEARVLVTGPLSVLDAITESDVLVRLELQGRADGTYHLTPTVTLSDSLPATLTAKLLSPGTLVVNIKKK